MTEQQSTEIKRWFPVHGYEDRYEVSDFGDVRSTVWEQWKHSPKALSPQVHSSGYIRIGLRRNKVFKHHYVHCLVMRAFVGPPPEGHETNHINGTRSDNRLSNLEYVTRSQNRKHTTQVLKRIPRGTATGRAKLNEDLVRTVKLRLLAGESAYRIAKELHVSKGTIQFIKSGHTWIHVTL